MGVTGLTGTGGTILIAGVGAVEQRSRIDPSAAGDSVPRRGGRRAGRS